MKKLILYDVTSKLSGNTWSYNPAKSRFVLGYMNLPFDTIWLEYADVEPELKKMNEEANKHQDGSVSYTVPTLRDPNNGEVISDSWKIAKYLDKTYLKTYSKKSIFPDGSEGLTKEFYSTIEARAKDSLRFTLLRSSEILNERSRKYFIKRWGDAVGAEVDKWSSEDVPRDKHWESIKGLYDYAKEQYEKKEGKWLMGDTLCYADLILAAHSFWLKRVLHADEWDRVASLHGGKWKELLAEVEKQCNLA